VLPAAAGLAGVPELHLWDPAEVNATVGLGIELEFEAELEVGVVLFGGEEESVTVVVNDAVFGDPVLCDVLEAFFLLGGELFGREGEVFGRVFSGRSPPTAEVLAVKK